MPAEYVSRVVDQELDELLPQISAIAIEGARGVGKTATAERRANTVHRLDEPAQRTLAAADPERLGAGEAPVLIDEWQRVPESWDVVRRQVDDDDAPSRFLLTGSATPPPGDRPTHTGAARIISVRMRPLTLTERGVGSPTVSLADLLEGARPSITGSTDVDLEQYTNEVLASGFPAIRRRTGRARRAMLEGYVTRIVETDFTEQGRRVRNPPVLMRWLRAYAAAISGTATYETIRDAAAGGHGDKPSRNTTTPYDDILQRLWIIEPVPAWLPSRNFIKRLNAPPKHQVVDPALAAQLLGVDAGALLSGASAGPPIPRDGTLLGALFESLVTLTVRTFAQVAEGTVAHMRTKGGEHEVDLIVVRPDQRVVGVEVKLARTVDDADVRHLLWLRDRIGDDFLDGVIITTGPDAYRRKDGIAVVPLALLGV